MGSAGVCMLPLEDRAGRGAVQVCACCIVQVCAALQPNPWVGEERRGGGKPLC